MIIGGSYLEPDDSLELHANVSTEHYVTWDAIKIDSPHKDRIAGIRIISLAGDTVKCVVDYYDTTEHEHAPTIWSEEYEIDNLVLSLKSKARTAYDDRIPEHNEAKRDRVLNTGRIVEKPKLVGFIDMEKMVNNDRLQVAADALRGWAYNESRWAEKLKAAFENNDSYRVCYRFVGNMTQRWKKLGLEHFPTEEEAIAMAKLADPYFVWLFGNNDELKHFKSTYQFHKDICHEAYGMKLKDIIDKPGTKFCFIDDISNGKFDLMYMVLSCHSNALVKSFVNLQDGKIAGCGEEGDDFWERDTIEIVQ